MHPLRITLLSVLIVFLFLPAVYAEVIAEFTDPPTNAASLAKGWARAEAFDVAGTPTVTEIQLYLRRWKGSTGYVTMQLRPDSNGSPSTGMVAQIPVPAGQVPSSAPGWVSFKWDGTMIGSGRYWIVCKITSDCDADIDWQTVRDNPYGTGNDSKTSKDGGTTWPILQSADTNFRVFGTRVIKNTITTVTASAATLPTAGASTITVTVCESVDNDCDDPGDILVQGGGTVNLVKTGGTLGETPLTLDNGVKSTTWTAPASTGNQTITANYQGHSYGGVDYQASSGNTSINVILQDRPTTTDASVSDGSIWTRETINVSATVRDNLNNLVPNGGTVSFSCSTGKFACGQSTCSVATVNGVAQTTWTAGNAVGNFAIQANYSGVVSGGIKYGASTEPDPPSVTVDYTPVPTTTTVTVSPDYPYKNKSSYVIVNVTGGGAVVPGGSVQLQAPSGSFDLNPLPLTGGTAWTQWHAPAATGDVVITGTYQEHLAGGNRYLTSVGNGTAHVVKDNDSTGEGLSWMGVWNTDYLTSPLKATKDDARGFTGKLTSALGWTGNEYSNWTAWELEMKKNTGWLSNGRENDFMDTHDFTYYSGHGAPDYITFVSFFGLLSYFDDTRLNHSEADDAWGTKDAEWVVFSACQELSNPGDWSKTMNGIHLECGYHTNMSDVKLFGRIFASLLIKEGVYDAPHRIQQAFFLAGDQTLDWTHRQRVIGANADVFNDYLWGQGYVAADPSGHSDWRGIPHDVVSNWPTADAGGPYNATVGVPKQLDGSASFDPDVGDYLTYVWDLDLATDTDSGNWDNNAQTTTNDDADAWGRRPWVTFSSTGVRNIRLMTHDDDWKVSVDEATVTVTARGGDEGDRSAPRDGGTNGEMEIVDDFPSLPPEVQMPLVPVIGTSMGYDELMSIAEYWGMEGEAGLDELGSWTLTDGDRELIVNRDSAAVMYVDRARAYVFATPPAGLPDDAEAIQVANAFLDANNVWRGGALVQNVSDVYWEHGNKGERTVLSKLPFQRRVNYQRTVNVAGQLYPVVGPGGKIVVMMDEYCDVVMFVKVWRYGYAVGNVPLHPPAQAIQDFHRLGVEALVGSSRVPLCNRIEIDNVTVGYYEEDFATGQNTMFPVYVLDLTCEDDKGSQQVQVYLPALTPPIDAIIDSPTNGIEVSYGSMVSLSGSAQGGAPPYTYEWDSDKDGPLGTGADIQALLRVNLQEGCVRAHTVTLRVTDSAGFYADERISVTVVPPTGDFDGDGDADQADLAVFVRCLAGPGVTTPPEGCATGEFDLCDLSDDGDVDVADFALFQEVFTGSGACGNGTIEGTEQCDDGGESAACDADCTFASCGDGVLNATAGEVCDHGGESATCDADCTLASCGDGTLNQTAGEECDDGGESATCDANCTVAACGDDTVNTTAGETCDDGGESALCDADCTAATCGDGTVNTTAGEECDDGGESASCDADCTAAICGDGTLNLTAGEECDDGNTNNGDGCSNTCTIEEPPLPECTILFNPGQCPNVTEVCGAMFAGGQGCLSAGLCANTPPYAYRHPGPAPLTITLSGDLNRLEVFFAAYGATVYGEMLFFDAQGVQVDGPLMTNGNCQMAPPPPQFVVFSRPVRSIQVLAYGGAVWIDTFHVNPP